MIGVVSNVACRPMAVPDHQPEVHVVNLLLIFRLSRMVAPFRTGSPCARQTKTPDPFEARGAQTARRVGSPLLGRTSRTLGIGNSKTSMDVHHRLLPPFLVNPDRVSRVHHTPPEPVSREHVHPIIGNGESQHPFGEIDDKSLFSATPIRHDGVQQRDPTPGAHGVSDDDRRLRPAPARQPPRAGCGPPPRRPRPGGASDRRTDRR